MTKEKYTFTAHIERDAETGLYVGYILSLPGAHTQAKTLDDLHKNLEEVARLCLEELTDQDLSRILGEFVGTQQVSVEL